MEIVIEMNIELHCTICGKSFLFSEGEIEYYKVRNLQPPKKCKACRQNPYSGLDESIKKLGLSSQDFSKNPASDTGFLPVGFPSTENRSYSLKYPVLQIDDIACYLRIYMVSSNEFTYILVNNEDEATVFPATDNLEWLENSVRKFYSISSIKYQYSWHPYFKLGLSRSCNSHRTTHSQRKCIFQWFTWKPKIIIQCTL